MLSPLFSTMVWLIINACEYVAKKIGNLCGCSKSTDSAENGEGGIKERKCVLDRGEQDPRDPHKSHEDPYEEHSHKSFPGIQHEQDSVYRHNSPFYARSGSCGRYGGGWG